MLRDSRRTDVTKRRWKYCRWRPKAASEERHDKILVLRDDNPVFAYRYGCDLPVKRAVFVRKVKRVYGIVPGRGQFARKATRQLRIHDELHAASGSMRLIWLSRAP
jgi:hypothetical protein